MTVKLSNFLIFKECALAALSGLGLADAVEIIKKKEHLTEAGLLKILGLKTNLNNGLSDKLRVSFPNITSTVPEKYEIKEIPDPN